MAIKLGDKVEDKVTGFTGIITGIAEYISGCRQALVVARMSSESGDFKTHWFDEDRLVDIPKSKKRNGGPQEFAPQ